MLFGSLMAVILTMITEAILYFRKQYIVRFTEHEKHRKNKKKAILDFWSDLENKGFSKNYGKKCINKVYIFK
jgi:hypothetical protein